MEHCKAMGTQESDIRQFLEIGELGRQWGLAESTDEEWDDLDTTT